MSRSRTLVHLLRHGEVDNPQKILYGRLPGYHLSELGARHGRTGRGDGRGPTIAHLVASPLERAQETAAADGGQLGCRSTPTSD